MKCRHCNHEIDVARAQALRKHDMLEPICTGRRRMQVNPFKSDVENDHTPELMCDGEAYEAMRDV